MCVNYYVINMSTCASPCTFRAVEPRLRKLLLRLLGFLPQGLGPRAVLRLRSGRRGGAGGSFRAAGRGSTDNSRRAVAAPHPSEVLGLLVRGQSSLQQSMEPVVAADIAVALASAGHDLVRAVLVSFALTGDSADPTRRVAAVPLEAAGRERPAVGTPAFAEASSRRCGLWRAEDLAPFLRCKQQRRRDAAS
jgi:hypothetical protein